MIDPRISTYSELRPSDENLFIEVREALIDCLPAGWYRVTDYTDRSRTRKADIIKLYNCAIENS